MTTGHEKCRPRLQTIQENFQERNFEMRLDVAFSFPRQHDVSQEQRQPFISGEIHIHHDWWLSQLLPRPLH